MGQFWTTFFYIVVMAAILAAAYFATKFLAKRTQHMSSKLVRMKDSMPVGRDKYIAIVESGGKTLLVGITNQSINLLAELDPDALTLREQDTLEQPQKGFSAQAKSFFAAIAAMKDAPKKLNRAQKEEKARRARAEEPDFLSQMHEAIRRSRSAEEQENEERE